jgi:hypothetical protein
VAAHLLLKCPQSPPIHPSIHPSIPAKSAIPEFGEEKFPRPIPHLNHWKNSHVLSVFFPPSKLQTERNGRRNKTHTLSLFNIAMENGPFIDDLPIKNGDFPWLC